MKKRTYFKVFCLTDHTPFFAIPTKKPHPKSLKSRGEKIDEDGVWNWIEHDDKELWQYENPPRHLAYATIANQINMKRAIREQVQPKMAALSEQVAAMKSQLDRIERNLDVILKERYQD